MEPPSSPPRYENVIHLGKDEILNDNNGQESSEAVLVITSSNLKVILNAVNTVTHFSLGAVVISAFMIANSGAILNGHYRESEPFSQHIYLCVTGYVILMSQAILSFNPHGGWAHGLKYPHKRMIHASMQIIGSILALTGCIIKIAAWEYYYVYNLSHTIFGWIAMVLTFLSLIGGVLNLKYTEKIRESRYKNVHTYLGFASLSTAFLCLCLGFSDWNYYFRYKSGSDLSITFTVFGYIGILISAIYMKIN